MFSGGATDQTDEAAEPIESTEPPAAASPARPVTTEAGRYLRATAHYEPPAHHGVMDDSAARMWEIAFGLAVRLRYASGAPLTEITRMVATAVRDRCAAAVPPLDAEMLVREALGETVPVGEMDQARRIMVHLLVFAALIDELALGDAELDALIAEAEELAAAGA